MPKTSFVVLFCGLAVSAHGQLKPEIAAKLSSANWTDRRQAFRLIADEKTRSREENSALVDLLLREESLYRGFSPDQADVGDGEAFTEYVGTIADALVAVADADPQTPGVWPALLTSPYNVRSKFALWLATHSDRAAPYFLAASNGGVPGSNRADALVMLAHIINYERDPATQHHLGAAEVQALDRTIRGKLDDSNSEVRDRAITALGVMGSAEDLKWLDLTAASDPYYNSELNYYTFRLSARLAAENLRRRLAAEKGAKQ
jgi:hypothetical protein